MPLECKKLTMKNVVAFVNDSEARIISLETNNPGKRRC